MTVASLWKALDRAGCGKPVDANDLRNHHNHLQKFSPFNPPTPCRPPTLAVDLSIWICESLTSRAMSENHMDPTLHLVYTRTLFLLNLGIQLVGVLEGKRRVRTTGEASEQFQKRRSGTAFWAACQKCEELLKYLGVPVVRASAEGEALCAFLNDKGTVDGVISNDGDCFLFGAKVIYTKFSLENIRQGNVMRYDISSLRAMLDDDDRDDADKFGQEDPSCQDSGVVSLTRNDLIAFAILTGSDIAGCGIEKVGCRKALRFIRKAQLDNPMRTQDAALIELLSWGKVARVDGVSGKEVEKSGPCCSSCCHAGNKKSHLKHGCQKCGTCPGEPCLPASPGAKFRKKLKAKVMGMNHSFDPESITYIYKSPNAGQLPLTLFGKTAADVRMQKPDLSGLLRSSLVIRGRSYVESRNYILKSLPPLLAKVTLSSRTRENGSSETMKLPMNQNVPTAKEILRELTRLGKPCYEVSWTVNATVSDKEGNPVDNFEFTTVENQQVVQTKLPTLLEEYRNSMKLKSKQGNAEQMRRQEFLESMLRKFESSQADQVAIVPKSTRAFQVAKANSKRDNTLPQVIVVDNTSAGLSPPRHPHSVGLQNGDMSDDAQQLLRFINPPHHKTKPRTTVLTEEESSYDGSSIRTSDFLEPKHCDSSPYKLTTTPGHLHFIRSQKIKFIPKPDFTLALSPPKTSWLDKSPPLKKPCDVETPLQLAPPQPLNLGLLFSKSLKIGREEPLKEARDSIPTTARLPSNPQSIFHEVESKCSPGDRIGSPTCYIYDEGMPFMAQPRHMEEFPNECAEENPSFTFGATRWESPPEDSARDEFVHFQVEDRVRCYYGDCNCGPSYESVSLREADTYENTFVTTDKRWQPCSTGPEHENATTNAGLRGIPSDCDLWQEACRKAEVSPWSESFYNSVVSPPPGQELCGKSEWISPPLCSLGSNRDVARSANRYDDIPLQGFHGNEGPMMATCFDRIDEPPPRSYLPAGLRVSFQPELGAESRSPHAVPVSGCGDGVHGDPDIVQAAMARLEKKCNFSRAHLEYKGFL
eukprot:Nitzschia sp. Nitz4//scaffold92_size79448//59772//62894//NITZ4_005398-RA/size79448-processed-gene-0.12-mRNA-1//1//CDS//3329560207//6188//frame0